VCPNECEREHLLREIARLSNKLDHWYKQAVLAQNKLDLVYDAVFLREADLAEDIRAILEEP
jgi:hypothetical protein